FLPYSKVLYLTKVNAREPNADVFFPTLNNDEWRITKIQDINENGLDYSINKYERR
ncbi:dihydrofolate reductase, partial [Candidatus Saccharibacteria bacterium]|nr:dihydrofolate reductase [Candidatus Saccharibacteria bacterium]